MTLPSCCEIRKARLEQSMIAIDILALGSDKRKFDRRHAGLSVCLAID